jgi:hypothetical protein
LILPIPTHTDYWQKLFNKCASHFQQQKELQSQKRETGSNVPNEQANKRCRKEEDPKAKNAIDIDTAFQTKPSTQDETL